MTKDEKVRLVAWAHQYHTAEFIATDPVQFPDRYRFKDKRDIEISGFLTAILSFGNRKLILRKADELDNLMEHSPLEYVLSCKWQDDFSASESRSFYRMLSYASFRLYFEQLYPIYKDGYSMEEVLLDYQGKPMQRLCTFLGVSDRSPQKKLNMFLRWMIRRNSPVDFGIWRNMDPADLIIPLDTHVCRVAYQLGLTQTETFSLTNAKRITETLADIFPDDPCLGDFALFGYGVNHKE